MSQNYGQADIEFHCASYTTVTNHCLEDTSLPLEARGLLVTMFSLRNDWAYSISGLQSILPHSKEKISRVIKVLEEHGYVVREASRDEGGHFKYKYHIYDESQIYHDENSGKKKKTGRKAPCPRNQDTVKTLENTESEPRPKNRDTGNPDTENPPTGISPQLNTNKSITEINKLKSINQGKVKSMTTPPDMIDKKRRIYDALCDRLKYEDLVERHPDDEKILSTVFMVMTETLAHDERGSIEISGCTYSYYEIEDVIKGLESCHIEYVVSCISDRGKAMTNPVKYILQCLIQAKTKDVYDLSRRSRPEEGRPYNRFNAFQQNQYDFTELERQLLDN